MDAVVVAGSLSPAADVGLKLPLTQTPGGRLRVDVAATLEESVNPQTGTTYTFDPTDWGRLVTFSNAAAVAATLPVASATFPDGWFVDVENKGEGIVTITPTTSTIQGGATLTLSKGQSFRIVSDATNYQAAGGAGQMQASEVSFTETSGAGVYTGSVAIPAGASIDDIIVNGVALWDNAGACTLKVGDVADDDGYYTGVNLKATDLLAGESLSFAMAGGKAGAYIANSQVSPRYSASARVISGIITTASTGGSAGRTRMTVIWSKPIAGLVAAATKV